MRFRLATLAFAPIALGFIGCGGSSEAPAEPAARTVAATDLDALRTRDVERSGFAVPPAVAELRPNVLLSPGEAFEALQLDFATLVRITTTGTNGDEVTLAEFDSNHPQLLLVSREVGIKLGPDLVRRGPLDRDAEYAIYLLPQGGVRNEVTRTHRRPATPQELEAARQDREDEPDGAEPANQVDDPADDPADGAENASPAPDDN